MFQLILSCKNKSNSEEVLATEASVKTTPLLQGDIEKVILFNGNTVYLRRSQVVSPIAGYILSVNVRFGESVQKGELLFQIQTRESKALESDKNSTGEVGVINVQANSGGFINELNINEPGGYVPEGGILCNIADNKDLMIKVNVPFEYNSILIKGRKCKIRLPDKTVISGSIFRILPVMDGINQTQTILISPESERQLPENLNVEIEFVNEKHQRTLIVNKSSLMTNETQSEFWVMKVDANNLAVKYPVLKGIENDSIAEIVSPGLKENDLIISEGAYGLPDSTLIRIEK